MKLLKNGSYNMYSSTRFSQVFNLIPHSNFSRSVSEVNADKYVKKFKCNDLLKVMIYGQLSQARSLRNLVEGYNSHINKLNIPRSTLSEALTKRCFKPFQSLCELLLKQERKNVKKECKAYLMLIDSTPIPLNPKKFTWAKARAGKSHNGLKLHTMIHSKDSAPLYANITPANINDISDARVHLNIEKGSTYVMDKGYYDYNWWYKMNEAEAYFITRIKRNAKYKVVENLPVDDSSIIHDQVIHLTNKRPRAKAINLYANKNLRLVSLKRKNGKSLEFITNDFNRSATEIAECYKKRWQIELFFKWIKQKLKLKSFFGTSENAIKIQIYCAIISYLLMNQFNKLSKGFKTISDVQIWLQHGLFVRDKTVEYVNRQRQRKKLVHQFQESFL